MKIVLVSPYTWTTPGGANAHIAGLAARLRARGHEVRILAPADGEVERGVIPLGKSIGIPFNGSVARIAFGPRIRARVRVALRRAKPEVIHVHEPFTPSASLFAAVSARVPVVATFHASMHSVLYRIAGVPLRPLWRKIDAKIAVSNAARDTVESIFGPGARIIPNGVDCARYAAVPPVNPAAKTILFFGRLEQRKGPQVLMRALPDVFAAHPDARAIFAGDGPMRAELGSNADDRVTFTGAFSEEERLALFGSASIACLPATGAESWGYTLVEAMAAGLPVVASAIPGYAAVAGPDAVLVRAEDPNALARALIDLLSDPDRARVMAESGRARATRFDWNVVAEQVEQVYTEVLARAASR